jgi:hypothetical protein
MSVEKAKTILEPETKPEPSEFTKKIRYEWGIKEGQKIEVKKPTHGSCCTCQKCGFDNDECRCERNLIIQACDLIDRQAARIKELEGLLRDALPHIECITQEQSNLISLIGNCLNEDEALKGGDK